MQPLTTHIYLLRDPLTGEVRYVGKTVRTLKQRLYQHVQFCARYRSHVRNWILRLKDAGESPKIELIETVIGDGWAARERFWISEYRSSGAPLTNATDGGEGTPLFAMADETKAKISAAQKGTRTKRQERQCAWCRSVIQVQLGKIARSRTGKFFCDLCCYRAHEKSTAAPKKPKVGYPPMSEATKEKLAASRRAMTPEARSAHVTKAWKTRRGNDLPGQEQISCGWCGAKVIRKRSQISKSGSGRVFCSVSCSVRFQRRAECRTTATPCGWCGELVTRGVTHASRTKSGKVFCCKSHGASYQHAPQRAPYVP